MSNTCGLCNKCYSQDCLLQINCDIHEGQCYKCQNCKVTTTEDMFDRLVICNICGRKELDEDCYYDYLCGQYLCANEFINLDLDGKLAEEEMDLPGGSRAIVQHIISFMMNKCIKCGRKLSLFFKDQLNLCYHCQEYDKEQLRLLTAQKKQVQNKLILQQQTKQKVKQMEQAGVSAKIKEELIRIKQKLAAWQHSIAQIKSNLFNEQESQCIICSLNYNITTHRPMMICLKQHLICQVCFRQQVTLLNCPLCKEVISRKDIQVSRQKLKTLQLQQLLTSQAERDIPHWIHKQVQTQQHQITSSNPISTVPILKPIPSLPIFPIFKSPIVVKSQTINNNPIICQKCSIKPIRGRKGKRGVQAYKAPTIQ